MKKAYQEIIEILSKIDNPNTISTNMTFHLAKLTEEAGELAKSINKLNGRKNRGSESDEEVLDNIEEETADAIQCLMAIAINAGINYESLEKRLHEKNKKFADSRIKEDEKEDMIKIDNRFRRKDNPNAIFKINAVLPDGWVSFHDSNGNPSALQQWNGKIPDRYEWVNS